MNLTYLLNRHLTFVEYFHANTTASFEEVKRKIEAREPPYAVSYDLGHADEPPDEPPFLEEWEMADAAMTISGAACLDLLKSTFHAFLNEYMVEIGNTQAFSEFRWTGEKGWFGRYKKFFEVCLKIKWAASGADLDLIEDAILTRNGFAHNIDLHSLNAYQTHAHSENHPESAFADPGWRTLIVKRKRLIVPGETLRRAAGALRTLCEYLERERHAPTKR